MAWQLLRIPRCLYITNSAFCNTFVPNANFQIRPDQRIFQPIFNCEKILSFKIKRLKNVNFYRFEKRLQDLFYLSSSSNQKSDEKSTSKISDEKSASNDNSSNENDKSSADNQKLLLTIGLISLAVLNLYDSWRRGRGHLITWDEFVKDILSVGEVEALRVIEVKNEVEVQIKPGAITVQRKFRLLSPYLKLKLPENFESKLRHEETKLGIPVNDQLHIEYLKATLLDKMMSLVPLVMFTVLIAIPLSSRIKFRFFREGGASGSGTSNIFDPMNSIFKIRDSLRGKDSSAMRAATGGVTFKDVAGLHAAKQEVQEFVTYLKDPAVFTRLGARLPRGALLLGPPGCGKTLLVKALANEADVPFFFMAGPEFVEVVGGVGASRVRQLFKKAREQAPAIIFIDEIDAIGRRRSGNGGQMSGSSSEMEHTLNQLLVELDGMDSSVNIIVFAATNRAEVLDKALLRRGRFDRHVMLDLPTMPERRELFQLYLSKYTMDKSVKMDSLLDHMANLSTGMSGADVANLCNEAALTAARLAHTAVRPEHLDTALERVVVGAAKRRSTLTPAERRVVAIHESGHALAGWMQKSTDALLRVSIVPRTNAVMGFAQLDRQSRKLHSQNDLFERMVVLLAGRAAECLCYDSVSTGAADDLQRVRDLAYRQVRELGMNERLGQLSFVEEEGGMHPYSRATASIIDEEARQLVGAAFKEAMQLLELHKEKLHILADELLKKEVLDYDDIVKLIGAPPFGHKKQIESVPLMASQT